MFIYKCKICLLAAVTRGGTKDLLHYCVRAWRRPLRGGFGWHTKALTLIRKRKEPVIKGVLLMRRYISITRSNTGPRRHDDAG